MPAPKLRNASGSIVRIVFAEQDGSTSELDLTPYVDLLLEVGTNAPRTEEQKTRATAVLGELIISDQVVFTHEGVEVDADQCLAAIGEGLCRVLADAVDARKARGNPDGPASTTGSPLLAEVVDQEPGGRSYLRVPDAFWELGCIADHERFDLIAIGGGALLLRPCPYTEQEFRAEGGGGYHADDPHFHPGSHCGLTKWVCVCGSTTIVETEEEFPDGWIEVDLRQASGDVVAFEAVCSMSCLAALATRDHLRSSRIPGFAPSV